MIHCLVRGQQTIGPSEQVLHVHRRQADVMCVRELRGAPRHLETTLASARSLQQILHHRDLYIKYCFSLRTKPRELCSAFPLRAQIVFPVSCHHRHGGEKSPGFGLKS